MGGSGKGNGTSKNVLEVLLKLCLAASLSTLALYAGASRAHQVISEGSAVKMLAFPNDLIAENPDGPSEHGDDGTKSGKTAIDSDLSCHRHPKSTLNACVNGLACNYLTDLQYKQDTYYPPTGPPVFSVTFTNTCLDCPLSNIHIGCGDFSSQSLVNPSIFRRLAYNDCLLNDGSALAPQTTIAFQYVSTFQYPMAVLTADNSACGS